MTSRRHGTRAVPAGRRVAAGRAATRGERSGQLGARQHAPRQRRRAGQREFDDVLGDGAEVIATGAAQDGKEADWL